MRWPWPCGLALALCACGSDEAGDAATLDTDAEASPEAFSTDVPELSGPYRVLRWDAGVVEWLATTGYTPLDGARPLRTLVQQWVEDAMAQQVLEGKITPGQTVELYVDDGALCLRPAEISPPSGGELSNPSDGESGVPNPDVSPAPEPAMSAAAEA